MLQTLKNLTRAKASMPSAESDYAAAMRLQCRTADEADALTARLSGRLELVRSYKAQQLFKRQITAAKAMAEHLRLRSDLEGRIPTALGESEVAAKTAVYAAGKKCDSLALQLERARALHESRARDLNSLAAARDSALVAPQAALQTAQDALSQAQDAGDAAATDHARAQLSEALHAVEAVEHGQRARNMEIQLMTQSVGKAEAQATELSEQLAGARLAHASAQMKLVAIAEDRAALQLLSAHLTVALAGRSAGRGSLPSAFDKASFFFHVSEHAPFWNGEDGWQSLDGWKFKRLLDAAAEPEWSVFEVDPASVTDDEVQSVVSATRAQDSPRAGRTDEPFDPRIGYPPGHPHFARATSLADKAR